MVGGEAALEIRVLHPQEEHSQDRGLAQHGAAVSAGREAPAKRLAIERVQLRPVPALYAGAACGR